MITRREFLQTSAASAAVLAAPAIVRARGLNSKLQIAGIGCDGKGWSDIHEMSTHGSTRLIGLCDVDLARTEKVRKLQPDAPVFQDYRELFDKLGDKIDAVTVSTPDHTHALITMEALRRGKHVYCQKPLTHTIWESRQLQLQAAKSGVITRLGNQIHSHTFYRSAVQAIQEGLIGKVQRVHSWCGATGHGKSGEIDRPKNPVPPPESLNWDMWVAGAPMRPYGGDRVYHPWGWRDWQDFGNGALGDFGCHILDPVFTALKLNGKPIDVVADHSGMNDEVWPAQTKADYTMPGSEYTTGDTLAVTWYDGGLLPRHSGTHVPATTALPSSGSIFVGEQGSLVLPHVGEMRLYPDEKYSQMELPKAEDLNHYHGWVDGCLSHQQPSDGFACGGPRTETVLLGNIAVRFRGQKLQWDADALRVTNLDEANQYVTRNYRKGWCITPVA